MSENKRQAIRSILSQIFVLGFSGALLIFIFLKRQLFLRLGPLSFLRLLLPLAFALYIWLLILGAKSIFGKYFLKRYDPGDAESVRELGKISRYRLQGNHNGIVAEPSALLKRFEKQLLATGAREVPRRSFGIVYERPASSGISSMRGRVERVILLYRPILNVLIEDRLISEAADYIQDRKNVAVRRNLILLMSDMENDVEMLSSAAGVVNTLSRLDSKTLLVPFLLDIYHGRLFYPQDLSMLSLSDRSYYRSTQRKIAEIYSRSSRKSLSSQA